MTNISPLRPVSTTTASLGITSQPAVSGGTTSSPNSRVGTGYSPAPAAVTGGGLTSAIQGVAANQNSAVPTGAAVGTVGSTTPTAASYAAAASPAPHADVRTVSTQFGAPIANDYATASGGGAISDALNNGVAKIAAFAQNGMKSIEQAIQGDMAANNGQVDPAKMQQYTMQMSTFEQIMQMAAKIQEKQDRAAQVWLQL
jgi:hypothetical protein